MFLLSQIKQNVAVIVFCGTSQVGKSFLAN